ncbi:unnamed protein product, partial [Owenia fusiformis]
TAAICICDGNDNCCTKQKQFTISNCPLLDEWSVTTGQIKFSATKRQVRKIREVTVHEDYNASAFNENHFETSGPNIALLRLDSPLQLNRHTKPASLPTGLCKGKTDAGCQAVIKHIIPEWSCKTAGWGLEDGMPITSGKLKWTNVYAKESDDKTITSESFGKSTTCRGDAGAPLMCQPIKNEPYVVLGISSYVFPNDACGKTPAKTTHTSLPRHLNWILKHVTELNTWGKWSKSVDCDCDRKERRRSAFLRSRSCVFPENGITTRAADELYQRFQHDCYDVQKESCVCWDNMPSKSCMDNIGICGEHGQCKNGVWFFQCVCDPYYSGELCDVKNDQICPMDCGGYLLGNRTTACLIHEGHQACECPSQEVADIGCIPVEGSHPVYSGASKK